MNQSESSNLVKGWLVSPSCRAKSKAVQSFLAPNTRLSLGFCYLSENLLISSSVLIHSCLHPMDIFYFQFHSSQKFQGCICIPLNLLDFGTDLNDCKEKPPSGNILCLFRRQFHIVRTVIIKGPKLGSTQCS